MGTPFITSSPTEKDILKLKLLMSVFQDGSGNQREHSESSRADWRQLERCVAELVGAIGGEDKQIFDVVAPDISQPSLFYGLSVKSKQLALSNFSSLSSNGRVYMEIANSPAKFWSVLSEKLGTTESDFRNQKFASDIGACVIETVERWHAEGKALFEEDYPGSTLDLSNSCYFCISLSKPRAGTNTLYQVHTFKLSYPKEIIWKYKSDKCLTGFDPSEPEEPIFDWYALSGGQLKYYPQAKKAIFSSHVFSLESPAKLSITDRAKLYFPALSIKAGLN
jgi:hypothetical protein